ncbi:uncharacterized protein BXIN_0547 [Babesia sp. Xinjiang]|uniref:uncharacterized protein n=1 Tax=Babesia sp. Xinjiang TaxID=462227 RepID=UPI000A23B502|nr:uncharacterized protein BXIN_0547 [Babesia sp. Xinjiang]ORM41953.1 hypothetical protein BXIN_0547 [Babesia sp. Xinjiang]
MAREESELPPYFRNKVAFSYGTLQRSAEQIETQEKVQHGEGTKMHFEVISFDNGPLQFNSIVFLPPGDTVPLNIENKAMHRFRSRSERKLSESDLTVFARVVLEDGGRRYVPLCLMEIADRNWLTFVYEVDEDAEDTTQLVDGLLVAGRLGCVSYILVRHREKGIPWTVVPEEEECLYYGQYVLDTIKSKPAVEAAKAILRLETNEHEAATNTLSLSHLRRYTDAATCKTLFEVREAALSDGREERLVQHLMDRLKEFLEPEIDVSEFDDIKDMFMDCYKHTKFIFSDKIPLNEVIDPVVEKCVHHMTFDINNVYFDILQVLVRDCDVAYRLMFDMGFGKTLVAKLVDTESKRWIQKENMLDMLIEIVSHGKCMRNFIRADNAGKNESLCDTLLLGVTGLRLFSMQNMTERLGHIGKRVELFLTLSRVEQTFQNLEPKLNTGKGPQYDNLEMLIHCVNEAIDMVKLHYVGKVKYSVLSDIREVRQYAVSYVMETRLPAVVTGLMRALLLHLESFPVAPFHISVMVESPLWLVAQYNNLIDFSDCLLYMVRICDLVRDTAMNNALQSGIYANSRVEYCKERCESMAIHTILLKMASALFGKRSSPQIVSAMHRICTEYASGFGVLATILSEDSVIQAVLHIITAGIDDLSSSEFVSGGPQDNMELWQLLNLVCEAMVKDESGRLIYVLGKKLIAPLGAFLDIFIPEEPMVIDLELQPLYDLHVNLRQLFNSPAIMLTAKNERVFENVDTYLREMLSSAEVVLHPDTLKQSFSKASYIDTMALAGNKLPNSVFLMDPSISKTMPKSMLSDQFSTVFSVSDESVELGGVHWNPKDGYTTRVTELGVTEDKANHYSACRLYVAPPKRLPEHVQYAIRLLSFAATIDNYNTVFGDLLQKREDTETLLRLWVHIVASISPDLDTVINAEMGVFKSLVGYEWFFASADAVPLVTNLTQVVYAALHHMSSDQYCYEHTDEHRPVAQAPLRFINDDILALVVISASSVMVERRWSFEGRLGNPSRKCLIWLCKLMSYWYRRFQKSQGYVMNKLMGWYTSIPRMADGAALLIVSCGPMINPNCTVDIYRRSEGDDELSDGKRSIKVLFEAQEYTVALRDQEVPMDEDVPNAEFWGLVRRIESLKVAIFAEFICTIASRCYSTNPCTMVLSSEIVHFLIISGVPIMEFVSALANRCIEECVKGGADVTRSGNISGKAYRLLTFGALLAKALVSNEVVEPATVLRVNNWILNLFSHYAKNCKVITEGCCKALFEGYVHVFMCHNNLWENNHTDVTRDPEFNNYMKLINGAVFWICQVLNGCKAKETETSPQGSGGQSQMKPIEYEDGGRMDSLMVLSWETILEGFLGLKHAFKMPFTALNILYTVLSGPMELIVKIINKQIDSEIIKVTPSAALWLHGIVRQLCDALLQHNVEDIISGEVTRDASLQLLILQLLHDVCASIHQTGTSQDVFIYALMYGTTHAPEADILELERKSGVVAGGTLQQQEDIYSDIVGGSKSRVQRKTPATVGTKHGSLTGTLFQAITDALTTFRDSVVAGLSRGRVKQSANVASTSHIANVVLLLNAFESLSKVIAKDAAERTPPKSLPGYIFLKAPSYSRLFRDAMAESGSTDGRNPSSTRSIITRVARMIRCEDWAANTCMVNQTVPSPLYNGDCQDLRWISKCFMFNGSQQSVDMWKSVRFLATAKLAFADELMEYAPIKTKRMDRPLPSEGTRYIRSVSTRAPSKHVDAFESEKIDAAGEDEDYTFSQENIEKAVAQLSGVITSQTWQDFDNDLVTNGLNLRSVLVNPGLLKDYSARATFLNALSRHVLIKELLISVGVDVR